jgi:hypothetical protein
MALNRFEGDPCNHGNRPVLAQQPGALLETLCERREFEEVPCTIGSKSKIMELGGYDVAI